VLLTPLHLTRSAARLINDSSAQDGLSEGRDGGAQVKDKMLTPYSGGTNRCTAMMSAS
jgi:hypothetical protein